MEENITKGEAQDLRGKLADLKHDLADVVKLTKDKVVAGTREWTKDHPLAAVAIAAGLGASIGFAIGLLIGRHKN